jgi:hypothetical protein
MAPKAINPTRRYDSVMLNEDLIRDALLKTGAGNLDRVLATIEAYRTCVETARRLDQRPSMETQRQQVLNCAAYCEKTLATCAATGRTGSLQYPETSLAGARFVLSIQCR